MDRLHQWLLRLMDEAFDQPAWHGPNLRGAVRGVSAEEAAWRPAPGRHNIWEIALHCAYWKHRVHHRVAPAAVEPFPRDGKDWPTIPDDPSDARWKADVALLTDVHEALRATVADLPSTDLHEPGPRQKRIRLEHLTGIAAHDCYHAGQIRLLRRLHESGGRPIR